MSDVEPGARVGIPCPACSPEWETVHEVVKPGGQVTVRCTECDHVHKERLPEEETVERTVVVSQDDESLSATADVPAGETLAKGEEFLVDTEEALMTARITSLELGGERRVEEATAEDVETIWSRAVGNVAVNVTMHPRDGRRDDTRSFKVHVPGDYEFVVGAEDELGGNEFTVEGFHVRDDAHGYDRDYYEMDGDEIEAKDVKRLHVRDESTTAWSAW